MRYLLAAVLLLPLSVNPAPKWCEVKIIYPADNPSYATMIATTGCGPEGLRTALERALRSVHY